MTTDLASRTVRTAAAAPQPKPKTSQGANYDNSHRFFGSRAWRVQQVRCRRANVAAAAVGLVLALPLMAVIATAIRLSAPGPVLYRQARIGLDRRSRRPSHNSNCRRRHDHGGMVFQIIKFRSMRSAETDAPERWSPADDPRITRIGKFLRRHRLDELPQLINVLRGEMNLVGPRPEQPEIFAELRGQVDNYALRQRVLPGITGWAQIHRAADRCVDDVRRKVQLDLEYLQRRSVREDLRIMSRTIPVMLLTPAPPSRSPATKDAKTD